MSVTFKIVIAVVLSSLATFLILKALNKKDSDSLPATKTALDADSLEGFTI